MRQGNDQIDNAAGRPGFRNTLSMIKAHPLRVARTVASCSVLLGGSKGYLNVTGWFRSRVTRSPVDFHGEAVPWITYPCIRFLEPHILPRMAVFEFGSGASTAWWSRRVSRVVSCEHDRAWFERVKAQAAGNVEMIHATPEGGQYSGQIRRYKGEFDIVVIDGEDRIECARNTVAALREDGIIVWDNADRDEYRPGFDFLLTRGFRRVDFWGMSPMVVFETLTSVFYRDGNCLGL
jgi:Methyltransferase domain